MKDLPASVELRFVEVVERHPPKGAKPIHWLLLTTHAVDNLADAWQIVAWYKLRWIIEQFFRSMKSQGLQIEDSQLETAEGLIKLVAIAARAACIVIQLVQARNGGEELPAEFVFSAEEIDMLKAINKTLQGKTELQKNHHPTNTLAWAAWIIAKLGGWSDMPPTSRRDQLPSTMAWLISKSSSQVGASQMCRCPSRTAGEGPGGRLQSLRLARDQRHEPDVGELLRLVAGRRSARCAGASGCRPAGRPGRR